MGAEELVGKTIAEGRFEIVRLLGEGGMGAVYQAKQVAMDRMVALKLIRTELVQSDQAVGRFHQEMRATAKVEHPNTIRVYDFGETDGKLYLAMEFLAGQALSKVLAAGRLEIARVLHIAAQVARALGAAHSEGIVHRDLKPDNVMLLDRYGERDFVKVLDFGIARSLDESRTQMTAAGAIIGTPAYMSPEQGMGVPVDTRSDLYSLGVMLYEMVGGSPPFNGPSVVSLLVAHAQEAPRPIHELAPSVPPPLADLIMQLLAKAPAERPQTAQEVAQRLEAMGAAPGTISDAVPPTIQQQRPDAAQGKKSKLPLVLGGALLVAGGVGAAIAFVPKHGGGTGGGGDVAAARLTLDGLLTKNGDPATPNACKTSDGKTLNRLIKALNENDDAARVPLLEAASSDSAERSALLARAKLGSAPADALEAARRALAICGDYAFAYNVAGNADQKLQKLDDAEIAYGHAIEVSPSYAAPRFNLGILQLKRNDTKAAIDQFTAIINYNPDHPNVFLMRAKARLLAGQAALALADLEEASRHSPTADVWYLLGDAREKQNKGDAQEAYCKAADMGNAQAKALCKR